MSIKVYGADSQLCDLLIVVSAEDRELFKELIFRGTNLWVDAPPAVKEASDQITNGVVMQDYYAQSNQKRPEHSHPRFVQGIIPTYFSIPKE